MLSSRFIICAVLFVASAQQLQLSGATSALHDNEPEHAWTTSLNEARATSHPYRPIGVHEDRICIWLDFVDCVSLRDGSRLWRNSTAGHGSVEPFDFAFGTHDLIGCTADGTVVAFDIQTGKLDWATHPFAASAGHGDVTARDGRVAVSVKGSPAVAVLNEATGALLWSYQPSVGDERGTGHALLTGDVVIVPFSGGSVLAFATTDGRQLWEAHTGERLETRIVNDDASVAVLTSSTLHSFNLTNGRNEWSTRIGGEPAADPLVADHSIFIETSSGGRPSISRIDGVTGQVRWTALTGGPEGADRSRMLAVDGTIVTISDYLTTVYATRLTDGSQVATMKLPYASSGYFVVVGHWLVSLRIVETVDTQALDAIDASSLFAGRSAILSIGFRILVFALLVAIGLFVGWRALSRR